jgi:hypothetical protein
MYIQQRARIVFLAYSVIVNAIAGMAAPDSNLTPPSSIDANLFHFAYAKTNILYCVPSSEFAEPVIAKLDAAVQQARAENKTIRVFIDMEDHTDEYAKEILEVTDPRSTMAEQLRIIQKHRADETPISIPDAQGNITTISYKGLYDDLHRDHAQIRQKNAQLAHDMFAGNTDLPYPGDYYTRLLEYLSQNRDVIASIEPMFSDFETGLNYYIACAYYTRIRNMLLQPAGWNKADIDAYDLAVNNYVLYMTYYITGLSNMITRNTRVTAMPDEECLIVSSAHQYTGAPNTAAHGEHTLILPKIMNALSDPVLDYCTWRSQNSGEKRRLNTRSITEWTLYMIIDHLLDTAHITSAARTSIRIAVHNAIRHITDERIGELFLCHTNGPDGLGGGYLFLNVLKITLQQLTDQGLLNPSIMITLDKSLQKLINERKPRANPVPVEMLNDRSTDQAL